MSLAGNLSDLSLPELLQVVALSRKTGALEICSEHGGVAWLGLRDGGIVRVALEDGDLERDLILKRAGLPDDPNSDVAEATLWDAAVQAILSIFEWTEGDFTFEPHDDPAMQWRGPQGIQLPSPLSPEFLALEGARLEDENASAAASARTLESAAESWESAPPEPPPALEIDLACEPAPPQLDTAPTLTDAGSTQTDTPSPMLDRLASAATLTAASHPVKSPELGVLICVDSELRVLELLKRGLQSEGTRIHIFQNSGDALQRFKQYVVRGETPALIVGSMVEDPLDAHQGLGWRRFIGRMLGFAPRLRVVVVARPGENVAAPGMSVVRRPDPRVASEDDYQAFIVEIERALVAAA